MNSQNLLLLQCCHFLKRDTSPPPSVSSNCPDFSFSVTSSPLNLPSLSSSSLSFFLPEDGYVRMFLRGRPVTMHIPDQQRESYSIDHKVALPDRKLKLQWVYPSHWERETEKYTIETVILIDQE